MRQRKYLFPHVIELNYQAGRRLGVNVYLIDGGSEFLLIDIGYLDTVTEIIDLIRQMDFNLSTCKMLIATHADADHIQGIARAKELFKAKVAAHPLSIEPLESGWAATLALKSSLARADRKSTRLNSSHQIISYAVFCLKKKNKSTNNLA